MNQEQTDAELKAQARGPRRSMQAAEQDLAGVHHLTSSQESPSTASKTADEPPVTTSSSPPTSGGTNPVTTDTISRLERDVSAKQQAAAGASSSSIIKPGAVHVVPTTADPDEGLEPPTLERGTSMDARIKARNRPLRAGSSQARRRSNSSSGQQQVTNSQASSVHRLEADVATKMNILNNGGSASSNAASSSSGHFRMTPAASSDNFQAAPPPMSPRTGHRLDMTGQASPITSPVRDNSAVRMNNLEADVQAKLLASPSGSSAADNNSRAGGMNNNVNDNTSARHMAALRDMEREALLASSAAATVPPHRSGSSSIIPGAAQMDREEIIRLEERIAYKTGISLDDTTNTNSATTVLSSRSQRPQAPAGDDLESSKQQQSNAAPSSTGTRTITKGTSGHLLPTRYYQGQQPGAGILGDYEDQTSNDLAVAVEIDEGKEKEAYIPSAIEYDPDAKPPLSKHRKIRLYGLLFCIILIGVVVGVAVGVSSGNNGNGGGTSETTPTISARDLELQAIDKELDDIFGAGKFTTGRTNPFSKAKEWLKFQDPMEVSAQDSNFVQRFTLALFYFQTSGGSDDNNADVDGWFSCGKAKVELNETDTCEFYDLRTTFPHDYDVTINNRWLSGTHECVWAGVVCDDLNRTSSLRLTGQNMTGTLPSELAQLTLLQSLAFGHNLLTGTISRAFVDLKHLINFAVESNMLTGSLPSELYRPRMRTINIGDNLLEGRIPEDSLEELTMLRTFTTSANFFTGPIPSQIGMLSSLTFLRLDDNALTGTLPSEIGNMLKLRLLWMDGLSLSTTIPSEIGNLRESLWFWFAQGAGLKGAIPDSFYELTNLQRALLNNNELDGTISPSVAQLTTLIIMDLHDNSFQGQIPSEIGALIPQLKGLTLDGNAFEGAVPEELCGIDSLSADCLPAELSGVPLNSCDYLCCTRCCDSDLNICELV